jgi:hypothetical protein
MRSPNSTPAAFVLLLAAAWSGTAQQQAGPAETEHRETSVTIALPADEAGELHVVAEGRPLDYRVLAREPWEVAIYFDQLLSDTRVMHNAAVRLGERASALADLGPVQILLGGETVRSALPPSTDAQVIDDALAWLRLRESSADAQAELRRDFVEAAASSHVDDGELQSLVGESVVAEAELVRLCRGPSQARTQRRGVGRRGQRAG